MFEVVFAGVSLAIVWGAMAERAKLWVYFAFGIWFTITYSIVSHWIWSPHGWLFAKGMQDFAGSTVVHYQGALAGLAGALILGPRIGKFGTDGRANPIPGHNIPYAVLGTLILWFGWFGFNPGSTLSVDFGGFGYFAYVALTTNIAAAAGAVSGMCVAWAKLGKPDISMMLNGALGRSGGDHGGVRLRRAVGGDPDRRRFRRDRRLRRHLRRADRDRRPDRRGRGARHVGRLGHARDRPVRGAGSREPPRDRHRAASCTRARSIRSASRLLGLVTVGAFTFSTSFGALWVMNKIWGIRVEPAVETQGLDVHEHGMWGYPEFYIPVPGGYGTESHGHLGVHRPQVAAPVAAAAAAPAAEPA